MDVGEEIVRCETCGKIALSNECFQCYDERVRHQMLKDQMSKIVTIIDDPLADEIELSSCGWCGVECSWDYCSNECYRMDAEAARNG